MIQEQAHPRKDARLIADLRQNILSPRMPHCKYKLDTVPQTSAVATPSTAGFDQSIYDSDSMIL